MIRQILNRNYFLQRSILYWSWGPAETYEQRKSSKRSLKIIQSFKVQHPNKLVDRIMDTFIMVPNFFTSQLDIKKFEHTPLKSNDCNYFLNSYVSCKIPLATKIPLREKLNKLFDKQVRIGRIFQIMDSIASMVSYDHCRADLTKKMEQNPMIVVTGSVESLHLFEKIDICRDITFQGYLNHVGKTSMEVQINVLQQDRLKANSIFTMIARNSANPLKGYQVPSLSFQYLSQSQSSKALIRLQTAKQNVLRRKAQMQSSYDRKAPCLSDIQSIHKLFLKRKTEGTLQTYPIANTVVTNNEIMHTQERNIHGKIFGGYLMREMIEIGWVAACKYTEDYMLMEDVTNVYFKQPVDVGSRLILKAQITYVQNNRVVITVQAYTAKFTDKRQTLACYLHLIARGSKSNISQVHPESYQQALQYLSSKKAFQQLFY